jgi:hypothetical protein
MAREKYLTNANLLEEIRNSKSSFCSFLSPEYSQYELIVKSVDDVAPREGMKVMVMTWDHIPIKENINPALSFKFERMKHEPVNFPPFQMFCFIDGSWVCVGKSHWKGGIENGHYCTDHGKLTNKLAAMYLKLVDRIGTKKNFSGYSYIEDMKGEALFNLCKNGLTFDESRGSNPFAYLTTVVSNSFLHILAVEKRKQTTRDDLLIEAGSRPSHGRLTDEHLKHQYVERGLDGECNS